MTWAIKDWNTVFENRRSRVVDCLKWVQWPVQRDSESYRRLMSSTSGMIAYSVFAALVRIAAHCPTRGVLFDDKGDITPERVALRIGSPLEAIRDSMQLLASKDIAWIVETDGARTARDGRADGAQTSAHYPTQPESTGHNTRASGSDRSSIPDPGSGGSEGEWSGVHPATIAKLTAAGATPQRFRELLAQRTNVAGVENPTAAALGILAVEVGVKLNGKQRLSGVAKMIQNRRSAACRSQ